jgi:hypothetical protein
MAKKIQDETDNKEKEWVSGSTTSEGHWKIMASWIGTINLSQ